LDKSRTWLPLNVGGYRAFLNDCRRTLAHISRDGLRVCDIECAIYSKLKRDAGRRSAPAKSKLFDALREAAADLDDAADQIDRLTPDACPTAAAVRQRVAHCRAVLVGVETDATRDADD
jgi:hypothetical protein